MFTDPRPALNIVTLPEPEAVEAVLDEAENITRIIKSDHVIGIAWVMELKNGNSITGLAGSPDMVRFLGIVSRLEMRLHRELDENIKEEIVDGE